MLCQWLGVRFDELISHTLFGSTFQEFDFTFKQKNFQDNSVNKIFPVPSCNLFILNQVQTIRKMSSEFINSHVGINLQ